MQRDDASAPRLTLSGSKLGRPQNAASLSFPGVSLMTSVASLPDLLPRKLTSDVRHPAPPAPTLGPSLVPPKADVPVDRSRSFTDGFGVRSTAANLGHRARCSTEGFAVRSLIGTRSSLPGGSGLAAMSSSLLGFSSQAKASSQPRQTGGVRGRSLKATSSQTRSSPQLPATPSSASSGVWDANLLAVTSGRLLAPQPVAMVNSQRAGMVHIIGHPVLKTSVRSCLASTANALPQLGLVNARDCSHHFASPYGAVGEHVAADRSREGTVASLVAAPIGAEKAMHAPFPSFTGGFERKCRELR